MDNPIGPIDKRGRKPKQLIPEENKFRIFKTCSKLHNNIKPTSPPFWFFFKSNVLDCSNSSSSK